MPSALIGYTGFVGSNLARQTHFDDFYNSKNIETIDGKTYDLVVCAGAPAEKWKINKEPLKDLENLNRLIGSISRVTASKFILISTVDVYPTPIEVDEADAIDPKLCHPYGKHRLQLERFVSEHFDALTVRLPGLFGQGLKKNVIFDLIHDNGVDQIHAENVFQFYNLDNLWRDIQSALKRQLRLVNFATEPVSVSEVAREAFGIEFNNRPHNHPIRYDFRSQHASLLGGAGNYLYNKQQVFSAIKDFVQSQPGTR